jgi:GTP-binding protein Era
MDQPGQECRSGFCAILGLPNAGKSTLLNAILGRRLVAVSSKPQTTRNRIVGVKNTARQGEPVQIVFVDTPGIQRGAGALRRFMQDQALAAAGDCDVAVHVVDVLDPGQVHPEALHGPVAEALAEALAAVTQPVILAANKVDRLASKDRLLPILDAYHRTDRYAAIVPISATRADGLELLEDEIASRLPLGPRLFPEDMITDRAERFLAAELIREQLFRQLGAELPYASAVVVESFEDRRDRGDIAIAALIHVERESQKGIVIGKGGHQIKRVGEQARAALAELFGCPVHLRLLVKVSSDWSRKLRGIRDMGYEE